MQSDYEENILKEDSHMFLFDYANISFKRTLQYNCKIQKRRYLIDWSRVKQRLIRKIKEEKSFEEINEKKIVIRISWRFKQNKHDKNKLSKQAVSSQQNWKARSELDSK